MPAREVKYLGCLVAKTEDGVVIDVLPRGLLNFVLVISVIGLAVFGWLTGLVIIWDEWNAKTLFAMPFLWLLIGGGLFEGMLAGYRRERLEVVGEQLIYTETGLLRSRAHRWPQDQIEAVGVYDEQHQWGRKWLELTLLDGSKPRVIEHRHILQMHMIADLLRRALNVPKTGE